MTKNRSEAQTNGPRAQDRDGNELNPGEGTVPILKELEKGKLQVVGTGFYISRYGLVLTAQHVVESLIESSGIKLGIGFIPHLAEENKIYMRRIIRASYRKEVDLAVVQANNYLDEVPEDPLMNRRVTLSTKPPNPGTKVTTYAYPENKVLDFESNDCTPTIRGDFYSGEFLEAVGQGQRPFIPYPHFETTIKLKAGASGGPVFDDSGKVIGVNCRGWEFADSEQLSGNLSSIVPIVELLPLEIELAQLPPQSWERRQISENQQNDTFTIEELGRFGHIAFDPPLT